MRGLLLAVMLIAGAPALAQEEDPEMVLQRCVWSCLANSNGADDPAYQSCVDAVCMPMWDEVMASEAPPPAEPAAAGPLPAAVQEFLDENFRFCEEVGGTPNASGIDLPGAGRAGAGYPPLVTEVDLNADGATDYITDLAGLECVDAVSLFCGSAGCPVTIWVAGPAGHEVAWGGSAQAWRLQGRDVVLSLHGQLCTPPREGAEGCEEVVSLGDTSGAVAADPGVEVAALAPDASPRPTARPDETEAPAAAAPAPAAAPDAPALPSVMDDAAPGWQHAQTADGAGWYAGTTDATTGARLDWLCGKGRPSFLAISPYAGSGRVVIDVDGRVQEFDVVTENGVAYAPIGFAEPLFLHIGSGRVVTVSDDAGTPIGRFTMDGAPVAIGQAEGRCRV